MLRPLLLVCAFAVSLAAATAPTREEWAPVEQALKADAANVDAQLATITQRFPDWPVGHRELARVRLRRHDDPGALAAALRAMTLDAADADAASIAIESLTRQKRYAEAFPIAERFSGAKDPKGWVAYSAAGAAFASGDQQRAETLLTAAKQRAGQNVPAAFDVLDSKLAFAADDLPRAEAALRAATGADPGVLDGWYELGRVRAALAERDAARADEFYQGAVEAFKRVTARLPDDYESWFAMGRCQLALGKRQSERDGGDAGTGLMQQAIVSLGEAVSRKDDLADAHLSLGEAHLRRGEYADAVTELKRAQELGSQDRSLVFNLAMALGRAGRGDEAAAVLKSAHAISPAEKVTMGLTAYRSGDLDLALAMLDEALGDDAIAHDPVAAAAVRRFIGHAHAANADRVRKLGGDGAAARVEEESRAALAAYRAAGDAGDRTAQGDFLALAQTLDAKTGYAAGLTFLGWRHWVAVDGWLAVARDYGASRAWDDPVHEGVWGTVIGLSLILWLKGLFRRRPKTIPGTARHGPPDRASRSGTTSLRSTSNIVRRSRGGDEHKPVAAKPEAGKPDAALEPRPGSEPRLKAKQRRAPDDRKRMERAETAPEKRDRA